MELCRLLSKWQKINTVLLKNNNKKKHHATLQKNAKILDNGLVQTTRFFGKKCGSPLSFSQKLAGGSPAGVNHGETTGIARLLQ